MVTEKTPDKVFDFFSQGIDLVIEGEWLKVRTVCAAAMGVWDAYMTTDQQHNQ